MSRGIIVQVSGASGSGKTHLMRAVMAPLGSPMRVRPKDDPTKRKPSLLVWPAHRLAVIGHYDVSCGGCDTIKSRSRPFELARSAADSGLNVLMEGLFVSQELHRVVALTTDGYERHNIYIHPPIEQCTANVMARRAAQGKPPKELRQMAEYHPRMVRAYDRLVEAKMPNVSLLRGDAEVVGEQALWTVRALLGLDQSPLKTIQQQ